MNVFVNHLPNPPHHEGQEVLRVRDGDYLLQGVREGRGYWLYTFVVQGERTLYTRMVRPAATVEDVRREGRWMLKQSH